jgi:hypothetical protein
MGDVYDARWKEFESLGEVEVRKRLAAQTWSEDKVALAHHWLEHRTAVESAEASGPNPLPA